MNKQNTSSNDAAQACRSLILCTGNSCRSQMAHGYLQSFDKNLNVFSAGTTDEFIHSEFIRVRNEIKQQFYTFYTEKLI